MRLHRYLLIVLSSAVLTTAPLLAQGTPAAHDIRDALEADRWQSLVLDGERVYGGETLADFYQHRDFAPVWSAQSKVEQLLVALATAESNGLRSSDYHYSWLSKWAAAARHRPLDSTEAADLDLIASDAFLLYGLHLGRGKVREEHIAGWNIDRPDLDLPARLERAASTDPIEALDGLLPRHPGYLRLRESLARYRAIAAAGGWPSITHGSLLKKGMHSDRVIELRRRLVVTRDLVASESPDFDDEVDKAVRSFQQRTGLDADGVVGEKTRQQLNTGVRNRIRQIEINLERWRWLPHDLGERYVLVNIAGFRAGLYDGDHLTLGMRAIVGKPYRRTPIFSDTIRYLVFSPYWNIPRSIAEGEIWPKGRAYMARHDIEVVEGRRLRQRPGPENALGRVKFIFPNRFNVYLHDTPAHELFARSSRSFSHGCIRLEKPIDLATELLAGQGWSRDKVLAAADSGTESTVHLDHPIPVHILYWTAWADENGLVQFRKDIYGRDDAVAKALDLPPPPRQNE